MRGIKQFAVEFLEAQGVKPLFICISGAHLYGFPSKDSDVDVRCCHVVPTRRFLSLRRPPDTFDLTAWKNGAKIDLVSYEVQKVLHLLLKNNSNIIENIFAPNIFPTSEHKQLQQLAKGSLSQLIYNPYKGMAVHNYEKFIASGKKKTAKKYLYVMRSLMAGAHVLRKGIIQPNIVRLNKYSELPIVARLVKLKKQGEQKKISSTAAEEAISYLANELELAKKESQLPKTPQNLEEFEQFILRVRMKNL